jgi:phenylacetate-coenzyme A ligase PaaK-like adenylate-forming protein
VNQETVYLEEENPNSQHPSELIATSIIMSPMPLIRYKTGDNGKLSTSVCSCGINLQTIGYLEGRTNEVFTSRDGHRISPGFWCEIFMDNSLERTVKRFQVIYKPEDNIQIRIVRGRNYNKSIESHIKSSILSAIFQGSKIEFKYPNEIKPAPSGKYQMVVNESQTVYENSIS